MTDQPRHSQTWESRTSRQVQGESNKRIRILQACQLCRARKSKCDGDRPACSLCRGLSQPCIYDPNPKKRGVPAGQGTALERRVLTMELVASLLMHRLGDEAHQNVISFLALDQDSSLAEVESWNEKATALLEKWKIGPMSEWVQEMSRRSDIMDDLSQSRSRSLRSASLSNTVGKEGMSGLERQKESTAPAQNHQSIEVLPSDSNTSSKYAVHRAPGNTQRYLKTYFAYTHTWLPLVDKFRITSFAEHTLSDAGWVSLPCQDSGNLSLLWAIIACASPHLSDQGQHSSRSETSSIPSREAYLNAKSLLPVDESDFKLEHTQALILLSLSQFWHGLWKSSWTLIGLAGRLVVDTKPPLDMLPPQHLSSSKRRTCLACFVVEGLIGAYLGRETQHVTLHSFTPKPHTEADLRWQLEEDGWEEWGDWVEPDAHSDSFNSTKGHQGPSRTLSTFNLLVGLVASMNKILFATHVFDASQNDPAVYETISKQLSEWYINLERSYPFLGLSNLQKPLLHVMNLHLIYWSQRCMLCTYGPTAGVDGNSTRELSEESNYSASKVNEIIMLYKKSYEVTLSSLVVSNAVAAAIRLVERSSTLGVQLRGYMEEVQQTRRSGNVINISESVTSRNKSNKTSEDPVANRRGLPRTMELEESSAASMVIPHTIQPLEASSDTLLQVSSAQPKSNLAPNLPHGENAPVPVMTLDAGIEASLSLFGEAAPEIVPDQGNCNAGSVHDLTFLDAMSWTDDSLARNFGYFGDSSNTQELYGNLEEFF